MAVVQLYSEPVVIDEVPNITSSEPYWRSIYQSLDEYMEIYGIPFAQYVFSILHTIYLRMTLMNLAIFVIKYVPTGLYTYSMVKNVVFKSRERMKQKQIELEDIELQIQIVKTKLCVRDAELESRAEEVRAAAGRLRRVRARVRAVLAADRTLARALRTEDHEPSEQDQEFFQELLKESKLDSAMMAFTDRVDPEEAAADRPDPTSSNNSVYSSLSDVDIKNDCHVKIVKVTNVYKVAYLKNYIKQRRLRRATKQALLNKKVDSIKKQFEAWQKTLAMVINAKPSLLHMSRAEASAEARGDYSKPQLDDGDLFNSDAYHDECISYAPYRANRPYPTYPHEDEVDHESPNDQCECARHDNVLFILPEETNSMIAFEERQDDEQLSEGLLDQ